MTMTHASCAKRKLKRFYVGGLPLIRSISDRMKLKEILYKYIPGHGNEDIPAVEIFMLLVYNLVLGKDPLYEMEEWVQSIDFRCVDLEQYANVKFNDDRFGRVLNKLFFVDRASLMTELVVFFVEKFNVDLKQLSNDSTSLKAYGKYKGRTRTGFSLKHGNSKDHRPDLKQLVFCLSISSDGGVPVHYKCYSGNVTDDKTHIETWNTLQKITPSSDFLYVADSKLCTDEQLSYIVGKGGRAVTIIPNGWNEVKSFKEELRETKKPKDIIWRRQKPHNNKKKEYFSEFRGDHKTTKRGYRIHWIYSSEKRKRDRESREKFLKKTEDRLSALNGKINKRNLKSHSAILTAAEKILKEQNAENYFFLSIDTITEEYTVQVGKGRPGKKTKYKTSINTLYILSWTRKKLQLEKEANIDGVFPLLCTDKKMEAKEVLKAYKYQPRLEKRFTQFKSNHNAAPLLFKKVERIEANMFAFFDSLVIQSLIEREVRNQMKEKKIEKIIIYPEEREAKYPTANKILELFAGICTYKIVQDSKVVESYRDELNEKQKLILNLLNISEEEYWNCGSKTKN